MTQLYADDGTVIGSFALEHRVIVDYAQIPPVLKDAVLSIEDRHFEGIGGHLPRNRLLLNHSWLRYSAIGTRAESVEPDTEADGDEHGCAKSQELRISPSPFSAHEAFIFGEARRAAGQVIHDVP